MLAAVPRLRRARSVATSIAYTFGMPDRSDVKYRVFPSLDHAVLRARLESKIKDPDVLWLAGRILAAGWVRSRGPGRNVRAVT